MLQHHIQKSIVQSLAFSEGLSFTNVKPDDLDNKLFTYHLKIVMKEGFVEKGQDGLYRLTSEGRRIGSRAFISELERHALAYSTLFLVVRRSSDKAWLLYKRKSHPLRDKTGFMHAVPTASAVATKTAAMSLLEKTGLKGKFTVLGSGYFRVFQGEDLESFTHFDLLVCEDAAGELQPNDSSATYEWVQDPDFKDPTMLPNMSTLSDAYLAHKPFFIDERLQL